MAAAYVAFLLSGCTFKNDEQASKDQNVIVQGPIKVTGTDTLTGDVGLALQAYYNMKDAFIKSDTGLVNQDAPVFVSSVEKIALNDINADPALLQLAKDIQNQLTSESKKLVAATDIESKRRSFQIISDGLFDLLRTIRYSGSKVYQQYCPMAFNNKGAAWLSSSPEIVNPYFGAAMLHCGDIRDSVNISDK